MKVNDTVLGIIYRTLRPLLPLFPRQLREKGVERNEGKELVWKREGEKVQCQEEREGEGE